MLAALGLVLITALPACAERAGDPAPSSLVRAIPLDPQDLASAIHRHDEVRLGPAWRLVSPDPRFGGFSGLQVDSSRLLLVSDRGWLWSTGREPSEGKPFRDGSWRVQLLRVAGRAPDAEELARDGNGRLLVTIERRHAIAAVPENEARPILALDPKPFPEPIASLPANLGVEALAGLPDGVLLAIAEGGPGREHLALALTADAVRPLTYRSAPGFAPTGAAWSDGWLYVVERRVSVLAGFAARLTATPIRDGASLPDVLEPSFELARLNGPGFTDNFEAVAAERSEPNGTVRLWLVSDDNFNPLQRTVLIAFDWQPQALARDSIRRFSRTNSEGSSASAAERR